MEKQPHGSISQPKHLFNEKTLKSHYSMSKDLSKVKSGSINDIILNARTQSKPYSKTDNCDPQLSMNPPSLSFNYRSSLKELLKLKEDLKLLDEIASCCVCLERLKKSVSCCVNGHAVCERCRGQLTKCPTCNLAFSNEKHTVLCQLLEALPQCCKHAGCTKISKTIQEHEGWCGFRKSKCRECDWEGNVKDLILHISSHSFKCVQVKGENSCLPLDGSNNKSMYVIAHNQLFWTVQKYLPDERKLIIELIWLPYNFIDQYKFEMNVEFEKGVRYLKTVSNIQFEPSAADACSRFAFHQDMLECFIENGSITYKFFITMK